MFYAFRLAVALDRPSTWESFSRGAGKDAALQSGALQARNFAIDLVVWQVKTMGCVSLFSGCAGLELGLRGSAWLFFRALNLCE